MGKNGKVDRPEDRARRVEGRQDGRSAGHASRDAQGRPGAAGDGLRAARSRSVLEAFGVEKDARGNARAATEGERAYDTSVTRCSPPATCGAASRWWSGRSAKAASARARSMSS